MSRNNSGVNDENLGIRAFQIKKGKAVERAIQLVRHDLGAQWADLTSEEVDELEWVLGELWTYAARADWEELRFGHLAVRDIVKILTLGSQLRRHSRNATEILKDVHAVVLAVSSYTTREDSE